MESGWVKDFKYNKSFFTLSRSKYTAPKLVNNASWVKKKLYSAGQGIGTNLLSR